MSQRIWQVGVFCFALMTLAIAIWPTIDLSVAGWFYDPNGVEDTRFWSNERAPIAWIYHGVQRGSQLYGLVLLIMLLVSLVPAMRWLQARRVVIGFLLAGLLIGPGLVVHQFKSDWPRPRPRDSEPFQGDYAFRRLGELAGECQRNCSFPSGHAGFGAYLMAPAFLGTRRRYPWLLAGLGGALGVGFARMAVGAHWLSDVLFSYWIVGASLSLTWLLVHPDGRRWAGERLFRRKR
ncbi:MAG: phosphatase PAP2 family protein [Pseudomonadota bacterium]